ncbi:MAG: DNA mismatch repair protein MutS [Candidatus Dadabacteria bacterium]|nr:DNA mismatch repair protein MutS [Candidatus Dadabacteria bacterium]
MGKDTPMMSQYRKIKKEYPDSILMFRLGDFYEMFFEDARVASKILGLALTSRNKSSENPVPLCGVPFHSVETYITRLLESGHKVAICDQIEDPKSAKGIVERKVTRVLTPGAVLDTEKLDSKTNNFIAAIWKGKGGYGLAHADVSTAAFRTTAYPTQREVIEELSHLEPREVLLPERLYEDKDLTYSMSSRWDPLLTVVESWVWDLETARDALTDHLGTGTLEPFGLEGYPDAVIASGAIIHYLEDTQMDDMPRFPNIRYYDASEYLSLDEFTKTNLELRYTLRGKKKVNTLLWVLDKTNTAMGGRLLKQWLSYPLIDLDKIKLRQDAVEELLSSPGVLSALRKTLREICDMERLMSRICTSYAKPTDLAALRDTSYFLCTVKGLLESSDCVLLEKIFKEFDELGDLAGELEGALVESPPGTVRDGGVIKEGYSSELDELRLIGSDGKKWISDLEVRERNKTGIGSLKVGFNKVFGYYLEVTKTNLALVPYGYIRKQTLVNAERYITQELKEFEEKILGAEEKIIELERAIFEQLRQRVAAQDHRVRFTAELIGIMDVLCSFAEVSEVYDYVRPDVNNTGVIDLRESRHPVVERMELGERFVPNDIRLDLDENQLLVITGPNMAGKSTVMRQLALIVIMAQLGCFVPARSGKIGLVDKIFTRVGASDDLARGQSTFMVEMVETAYILRHATKRSLVIFDEIGRGTSTFDGMSLAWAVAEHIYKLGARTMFATHYHELAELGVSRKRIKNYNVYVKEEGGKIVFLRTLVPGATSHSYGIQVARLAGVPDEVIKTAKSILEKLEKAGRNIDGSLSGTQIGLFSKLEDGTQEEMSEDEREVVRELKTLDPMSITPLDALNMLSELKKRLNEGGN